MCILGSRTCEVPLHLHLSHSKYELSLRHESKISNPITQSLLFLHLKLDLLSKIAILFDQSQDRCKL